MSTVNEHFSWFALQVRTRHEAGLTTFLEGKGYECFLPAITSERRWSDRVKRVQNPLFPGYVFCRFNPQNRLPILTTPGVIQIVGYNRSPVPIEETEIAAIQALIASGLPSQPWPFLKAGDHVRIESGPLRGFEGLLLEFKGKHRLLLSITLLQRSVAVEIDTTAVASVPSPAPLHRTQNRLYPIRAAV